MYDYLPKEFKIKGISVGDFPFANFNNKDKKDPDLIAAAIQYYFGNIVYLDINDIENIMPSKKSEIDNFFKNVISIIDVNPYKICDFFKAIKNNEDFKSFIFKKENLIKCLDTASSNIYHAILDVMPEDHPLFLDKDYSFSVLEKMYKHSAYNTNKFCLALMSAKNNKVNYQNEVKIIAFLQKSLEDENSEICKMVKNLLKDKESAKEFVEYAKKFKILDKNFFYNFYSTDTYKILVANTEVLKVFCEETNGVTINLSQLESLLGRNAKNLNAFKEIIEILAKNNVIKTEYWEFTGNFSTAYNKNPEFFKVLVNNVVGFVEENVFNVIKDPECYTKDFIDVAHKMTKDIDLYSWSENMWESLKRSEGYNKNSWFYEYFPSTKINKMSMEDFKVKMDKIVNFFLNNKNEQTQIPVKKATAKKL